MPKMIFLDIDGTITMPGIPPSPETVSAIETARANGNLVFISTGRAAYYVDPAVSSIGFDGGIFHAGGRATVGNQAIVNLPIDQAKLQPVIDMLQQENIIFHLETEKCMYTNSFDWHIEELPISPKSKQRLHLFYDRKTKQSKHVNTYQGEPIYKVSILSFSESQRDYIRKYLPSWAKLVWFQSFFPGEVIASGEITDISVNKASAMLEICQYFHHDIKDCIAFGDSMNDAEIIHAAGMGVAMGNSEKELKEIADYVCQTCEENGVAKALKQLSII